MYHRFQGFQLDFLPHGLLDRVFSICRAGDDRDPVEKPEWNSVSFLRLVLLQSILGSVPQIAIQVINSMQIRETGFVFYLSVACSGYTVLRAAFALVRRLCGAHEDPPSMSVSVELQSKSRGSIAGSQVYKMRDIANAYTHDEEHAGLPRVQSHSSEATTASSSEPSQVR